MTIKKERICICGFPVKKYYSITSGIFKGYYRTCGNKHCIEILINPIKKLEGMVFERLTVIRLSHVQNNRRMWLCLCKCGVERIVRQSHLQNNLIKSCGCLNNELRGTFSTTHGYTKKRKMTDEYKIWTGIKKRCYNTKCKSYKNYGGRGISICERWFHSFENFLLDMGTRPPNYSIERINNDGNYEPQNCKWIPKGDQSRNRRSLSWLEYNGLKMIKSDWAKKLNISSSNFHQKLKRYSLEKIHQDILKQQLKMFNYNFKQHTQKIMKAA